MIVLQNVSKTYGQLKALKDITFSIDEGKTLAIIGASGSGKSTLLRCINHLETLYSGAIFIEGVKLTDQNHHQTCAKIGMVFQNFNLFPHMDVLTNLIYAPVKILKISKDEAIFQAQNLLRNFGLTAKSKLNINDLSGGQKQRVAIARALMMKPKYMLFDEPTSALDPERIKSVVELLQELKNSMTIILVTHQIKFTQQIADRVIFMDNGLILDDLEKDSFFHKPRSHRARLFLENVKDYI